MTQGTGDPSSRAPRPRALIIQRVFPHYRLPFFDALAASPVVEFALACGAPRSDSALLSTAEESRIRVHRLRNLVLGRDWVVFQRGIRRLVENGGYDAVIAEFNPRIVSNIGMWLWSLARPTRFIWWGQGLGHRGGRLGVFVRTRLARHADAVILYSAHQRETFARHGVPLGRLFVAPNSLDTASIAASRKPHSLKQRKTVLFVGRLIAAKRVDDLLRAYALAEQKLPDSQLAIVGDGPERPRLQRLAAELMIEHRVDFAGALYEDSKLSRYFNDAWCVISVGGIGLTAVQSLAYGVPVIIAEGERHGPEAEMLRDGINAIRVSSSHPGEFAKAMVHLRREPEEWERLHRAALRSASSNLGIQGMVDAFHDAVLARP